MGLMVERQRRAGVASAPDRRADWRSVGRASLYNLTLLPPNDLALYMAMSACLSKVAPSMPSSG